MSSLEEKIAQLDKKIDDTEEEIKKHEVGSEIWKILMAGLNADKKILKELLRLLPTPGNHCCVIV